MGMVTTPRKLDGKAYTHQEAGYPSKGPAFVLECNRQRVSREHQVPCMDLGITVKSEIICLAYYVCHGISLIYHVCHCNYEYPWYSSLVSSMKEQHQ